MLTFIILGVMVLVCIGIYKMYVSKTPENEREKLIKKKESK